MDTYYMVSTISGELVLSRAHDGSICFLPWEFGQALYLTEISKATQACELFKKLVKLRVEKVQGEIREDDLNFELHL